MLGHRPDHDGRDAAAPSDSLARRLLTNLRAPLAAASRLFARLRGALLSRRPALGDGAPTSSGTRTVGRGARAAGLALGAPRRPLLRRALDALRELPARAVMATRLRRIIGRRYARYLQRVFEMFDGNRLEEALPPRPSRWAALSARRCASSPSTRRRPAIRSPSLPSGPPLAPPCPSAPTSTPP